VPLYKQGSSSTYATNVNDIVGSTSTNYLWELDGYSAYSGGQPDTSGSGGVPQVWTQADYRAPTNPPANNSLPFNGYTQGPGYYGMTFFVWPPDPRNTIALSGNTLKTFLKNLGITGLPTGTEDQTILANVWSTWQGMGATGLAHFQDWLKGVNKWEASSLPTIGSPYYSPTAASPVAVPNITTWNGTSLTSSNKPLTYYAVCRLFNRAYPGGAAWTSTSFHGDWRLRFFGANNNTLLFNSGNGLKAPSGSTYTINYNAILGWINNSGSSRFRVGQNLG
jgi:hypothetical protein